MNINSILIIPVQWSSIKQRFFSSFGSGEEEYYVAVTSFVLHWMYPVVSIATLAPWKGRHGVVLVTVISLAFERLWTASVLLAATFFLVLGFFWIRWWIFWEIGRREEHIGRDLHYAPEKSPIFLCLKKYVWSRYCQAFELPVYIDAFDLFAWSLRAKLPIWWASGRSDASISGLSTSTRP